MRSSAPSALACLRPCLNFLFETSKLGLPSRADHAKLCKADRQGIANAGDQPLSQACFIRTHYVPNAKHDPMNGNACKCTLQSPTCTIKRSPM